MSKCYDSGNSLPKRNVRVKVYIDDFLGITDHKAIEYTVRSNDALRNIVSNIYDIGVYLESEKEVQFYPPEAILQIIAREE